MLENHEQRAGPRAPNWTMQEQTDKNRIRLVLLDDHGLFRAGLARLLASESGVEVVGECGTCAEGLEIVHGSPVDVILLDFDLGPEHATDFISAARTAGYEGRFLIVAAAADAESAAAALKRGASGVFLKSEALERLLQAIRLVATGAVWVDQKILRALADQCLQHPPQLADQKSGKTLEARERKVLLGILGGLKNKDIAKGMGISESSVKNVLQALFSRTGVRTRSQLVRLVLEGSLGKVHLLVKKRRKAYGQEMLAPDSAQSTNTSPAHSQSPV